MDDEFVLRLKGMTVRVFNNNIDSALIQLKRRMNTEGINKELRKRKHFTSKTVLRRQDLAEAKLRWKKKHDQIFELEVPKKPKKLRKGEVAKPVNKSPIDLNKF